MSGDDQLLGELKGARDDHERRLGDIERDLEGIKRFQTSFLAIVTAAVATVAIWWKGVLVLLGGK